MDWARSDHPPLEHAPSRDVIEVCWRAQSPTGRIITCAVYAIDSPGVELRASDNSDTPIVSLLVANLGQARHLASSWIETLRTRGRFEMLPTSSGSDDQSTT